MKRRDQQPRSTTFRIDGDVDGSSFSDIYSTADDLLHAGGSVTDSRWERILHDPIRTETGINWAKVGALAGMAAVVVAAIGVVVAIVVAP
jgi:hypothetical protein